MGATDQDIALMGPAAAPAMSHPLLELPQAWARWIERLMVENRLPLSGNVDQWIRTWSEAVSQIGLVNYNVTGSSNPGLEKRIGSKYSYGRQLGRMLDMLGPLVDEQEALLRRHAGDKAVDDFQAMRRDIGRMKQHSVDDILQEVSAWPPGPESDARLEALIARLQALQRRGS